MTDWDKELRRRRTTLERAQRAAEEAAAGAHADGHPYRWISERLGINHETVRKVVSRVDAERCNAVGDAPNSLGTERCELPAGHEGRHYQGIITWPNHSAPARPEEES
jgi:hypothetical protein